MKRSPACLAAALIATALPSLATPVFLNEIHYDNVGGDDGEFVEIAGPAGTDLTGWRVILYNGSGGAAYETINLSGAILDEGAGFGALSFLQAGIQNGSPDGLALVDATDAVIQFLSYEGAFTAVGGPADGLTSSDIGVSEDSSTPIRESLQLTGTGTTYSDFSWSGPAAASPGAINAGQSFAIPDGGTTLVLMSLGILALPAARAARSR